MDRKRVEPLNLFTPVLDGIDSAGSFGDVLKSAGPNETPFWAPAGTGDNVLPPGDGSNTVDAAVGAPVLLWAWSGAFVGAVALVPNRPLEGLSGITLHIQGTTASTEQEDQGAFDLIVQCDLLGGTIGAVTVQGSAPDVEVSIGRRPADEQIAVLLGNPRSTVWVDPVICIVRVIAGIGSRASNATVDWSGEIVADPAGWNAAGAITVGPSWQLRAPAIGGNPAGAGGRFSAFLGGFATGGASTGVLVWEMGDAPADAFSLELSGNGFGADGVHCLLRLTRSAPGGPFTVVEIINLAPVLPPAIRTATNPAGRPVLLLGEEDTGWMDASLAFHAALSHRDAGLHHRPFWFVSHLLTDLAGYTIDGTGVVLPIAGSAGEGQVLRSLTPGQHLTGSVYNGQNDVTWDVTATTAATPNRIVSRDGSGDIRFATAHGELNGNAASATRLRTARLINGVPFDGTSDITIATDTPTVRTLTPGSYLEGGSFNGGADRTWNVLGTTTNTPNRLVARDGSGGCYATTFYGSLAGLATAAARLQPGARINGVLFDGSSDITIGTQSVIQPLTPGSFLTGKVFNGSEAVTFAVDGSVPALPNKVAVRDPSGNLSANTFNGDLSGQASRATRLSPGASINGVLFDGSTDITIPSSSATLTRGSWLLGSNFNGSANTTWAVDGSTTASANKVAVRDGDGALVASTFYGNLAGLATAATRLSPGARINGVLFDGSTDITLSTGTNIQALTPGAWLSGPVFNGQSPATWTVLATTAATGDRIAARDLAGQLFASTFVGALQGNASSSSRLQTARNINGVAFDGTQDITIPASIATLTRGTWLTGSNFNGGAGTTWAVDGSITATANKVAVRDSAGALTATTFYGNLAGLATAATRLSPGARINGVLFDGSSDITLNLSATIARLTAGAYLTGGFFDGQNPVTFAVDGATAATPGKVAVRDASGNLTSNAFIGSLTGNAASATRLQTPRAINGVAFDGTANITIADSTRVLKAGDTMTGTLTAPAFNGPLNGNATSATQLQTPRTINGVPFDGTQSITISDNTRVLKTGDTMTGNLNMAPGTYVNLQDTAEIVSNPRPRNRNFLWMRTANDDVASMGFDGDGKFDCYGSDGIRLTPGGGDVTIWQDNSTSYTFAPWGALFERSLIARRNSAGPGLVVTADTQPGDDARGYLQFTNRDLKQQWATIESRNFRTDYTGRDQCWLRAGTEVGGGSLYLSGGWQSDPVIRILRGNTVISYINSSGDYVKGVALQAPEALSADASPLERVAPFLTDADIVTQDQDGTWLNESALIASLTRAVQELTARVRTLEEVEA